MLIDLFRRIGLEANIAKSKTMLCQLGVIWSVMAAEAFNRRSTGEGANYCDHPRRQMPCHECGVDVKAGSLTSHRIRMNGTEPET